MADDTEKPLRDLREGDEVLSYDGQNFVADIVKSVWLTQEKETIRIQTVDKKFKEVICSKDHLFGSKETHRSKLIWVKAANIRPDQKVLIYLGGVKKMNQYYHDKALRRISIEPYGREELYDMETTLHHNFIANGYLVHNSGKDVACWNLMVRQALMNANKTYVYCLPKFEQARDVIWNARLDNGQTFHSFVPEEMIAKKLEQKMAIVLKNGSQIMLAGSDSYDRLVGMNFHGLVMSEAAIADLTAWSYFLPILEANDGWAVLNSTPRGCNEFYDLWNMALANPDKWFTQMCTVKDTGLLSEEKVADMVSRGEISFEKAQQEFYTSFNSLNEKTYYGRYIDDMRDSGRIGDYPWDPRKPVFTSWDWGHRDQTVCVFAQLIQGRIIIIDCYANKGEGMEHYAKMLQSKPYSYGAHVGPHDMRQHEQSSGNTRWAKMHDLGYTFKICISVSVQDGIEAVRTMLPRTCIAKNTGQTKELIKALENYRSERIVEGGASISKPVHDTHSDFCFTGDMKVLTSVGELPISEIKEGMLVRTPTGFKKVLKVHIKETDRLCDLFIGKTKITCTPEHKFFSNNGLVRCDSLRYSDLIEYHSVMRSWFWKKLYGLLSREESTKGFKKTILSLKTNQESSLMAMFINYLTGTTSLTCGEKLQVPPYTNQFGYTTMVQYLKDLLFTIKIKIGKITQLIISKLSTEESTKDNICLKKVLGVNQKTIRKFWKRSDHLPQSGMAAQKDSNGIEIMPKHLCQESEEYATKENVYFAVKTLKEEQSLKNTVAISVKTKVELYRNLISKTAIVACAKLYLIAADMLRKKHVVKSVHTHYLAEQKKVYDLSVVGDNCYYINGYLVSNCDAVRMLALMVPTLGKDDENRDRYRKMKEESQSGFSPFFR
jgi:hypothetical protein